MRPERRRTGGSRSALHGTRAAKRGVAWRALKWALTWALTLALTPQTGLAAIAGDVLQPTVQQPTVQQPRAFGYLLGDVITQRILLPSGDHDAGEVSPPSVGRIGEWLERRPARFDTDAEGRRWMAIDYQVVDVAPALTRIALPALTLTTASGATLQVAQWPLSVSPMTPVDTFAAGDLQPMRPDRLAPSIPAAPLRRQAGVALGLLLLTLLSWAGWWLWRNWRESARLPFARAWRQMRRLDGPNADTSADAWLCLHRALNEAAGQVVHAGSLPGLFARAPYLQPLRAQLEQFYRQSTERFFAPAAAVAPYPLRGLCRALYRAEQRQQR